jgi:HSP20 family protein
LGRRFFIGANEPEVESKMGASMPAVNIHEDTNQFSIEMAALGMQKKVFKLDLNHNVLTISAEKEENNKKITRKEFNYTSFIRSFTLPNSVKDALKPHTKMVF